MPDNLRTESEMSTIPTIKDQLAHLSVTARAVAEAAMNSFPADTWGISVADINHAIEAQQVGLEGVLSKPEIDMIQQTMIRMCSRFIGAAKE
jgi:hypothetical protein